MKLSYLRRRRVRKSPTAVPRRAFGQPANATTEGSLNAFASITRTHGIRLHGVTRYRKEYF